MTTATVDAADDLLLYLSDEQKAFLKLAQRRFSPAPKGKPVPADWRQRIPLVFPKSASAPFADRHVEFWTWGNAIELESSPDPFVAAWPRGGAKSTSAEMLVADLGARGKRRYCLYVRMTQDKADDSVQNVASLLEGETIERHYPSTRSGRSASSGARARGAVTASGRRAASSSTRSGWTSRLEASSSRSNARTSSSSTTSTT
jgi:hypothetical protein